MHKLWKAVKSSLDIRKADFWFLWTVIVFGGLSGGAAIHGWWIWAGMFYGLMLIFLVEYAYSTKRQYDKDRTTTVTFYGDIPNKETVDDIAKKIKIQGGL